MMDQKLEALKQRIDQEVNPKAVAVFGQRVRERPPVAEPKVGDYPPDSFQYVNRQPQEPVQSGPTREQLVTSGGKKLLVGMGLATGGYFLGQAALSYGNPVLMAAGCIVGLASTATNIWGAIDLVRGLRKPKEQPPPNVSPQR
jgi:hypothetical protein